MSPNELSAIQEINTRLDKLEGYSVRHNTEFGEMRNDVDKLLIKTGQMHTALIGNDISKDGGLVRRVEIVECNTRKLKVWKTRITAVTATLSALFTAAASYFAILKK